MRQELRQCHCHHAVTVTLLVLAWHHSCCRRWLIVFFNFLYLLMMAPACQLMFALPPHAQLCSTLTWWVYTVLFCYWWLIVAFSMPSHIGGWYCCHCSLHGHRSGQWHDDAVAIKSAALYWCLLVLVAWCFGFRNEAAILSTAAARCCCQFHHCHLAHHRRLIVAHLWFPCCSLCCCLL